MRAQKSSSPLPAGGKDALVFTNGEKLIGTLERSTGDTVVFKSDMAGEITVKWSNVKELHSPRNFAVIEKGTKLHTGEGEAQIPQGAISVSDGGVLVYPPQAPPLSLSLERTADLIDESTFARVVLSRPAWYRNWRGAATVGLSLVRATQTNQTYTSNAKLIRDVPGESWMDPENRTILEFNSSFGQLTQPSTPTVKTSIFHAHGERDRYFSPRAFTFLDARFDHDYSQGLDLQQLYSTGVGFSVIKTKNEQLDLKSSLGYEDQKFFDATQNQHLVGSGFSESYDRKFETANLHQDLLILPSWSNLNAYSVNGNLSFTVPIFKRISFTVGIIDTFLNNPSRTFRKNSFQFSSGITYQFDNNQTK